MTLLLFFSIVLFWVAVNGFISFIDNKEHHYNFEHIHQRKLIFQMNCGAMEPNKPLHFGGCGIGRRAFLGTVPALSLLLWHKQAAQAMTVNAEITDKVFLDISINGDYTGRIILGLFGKDAPATTGNFLQVAQKTYMGDISYDYSTVFRIEQDKRIDMGRVGKGQATRLVRTIDNIGKVRTTTVSTAEDTVNYDKNDLQHNTAGLLSMQRGGGTFEFTITPGPNSELDSENIVFGKVLEGMDVINQLNQFPTTKDDAFGTKGAFSNAGKSFDPRAKMAYVNRPLGKILIVKAGKL